MQILKEALHKRDGLEQPIDCMHRHLKYLQQKNANISLHYHEYIEFLYGIGGRSRVYIGDKTYVMDPGDLIVANKGEVHEVACIDSDSDFYVIKFLPSLLYTPSQSLSAVRHLLPLWQKQVGFHPAIRRRELDGSGIDGLVSEIMQEWKERSPGYELIVHSNIMRMFVWILRQRCSQLNQPVYLPQKLQNSLQIVLEESTKHLDDWSAREAAEACGLSYNYFCHNFKLAYGLSYTAYLESLRLHEAERLLLTTDKGITDIALAVGFGTTSYFIERFKKKYGIPPKAFRNQFGTQR